MALIDKASLLMVPSTYEAGKLYNVLPSGNRAPDNKGGAGYDQTRADFDFDRGSNAAATRINSSGLIEKYQENLLLQSNNFTSWSNIGGTMVGGQSGYDGSNDAYLFTMSSGANICSQTNTQSGVQTYSVYAKGNVNNGLRFYAFGTSNVFAYFDLNIGAVESTNQVIDANIEDKGNGWYRCSMTFNQTNTQIYMYLSNNNNTNASSGSILIQNAQLETGLAATDVLTSGATTAKVGVLIDLPRINYDANGENGALLLEPSRQQLVPFSEYAGTNNWGNPQRLTTIANQTTSPEGIVNATKVNETAVSGSHMFDYNFSATSGVAYTFSYFAKAAERTQCYLFGYTDGGVFSGQRAVFNLSNGTITSNVGNGIADIQPYSNGWYRVSLTLTSTATSSAGYLGIGLALNSATSYLGVASSGINMYGLQLEGSASYASSYIPNHGTSGGVTRAADSCSGGGSAESINSVEGVLYAEIAALSNDGTYRLMNLIDDSNNDNFIYLGYKDSSNTIRTRIEVGGAASTDMEFVLSNETEFNKIAVKWKTNDFALWVNGIEVATDSSGVSFTANTLDKIDFDRNGNLQLNANVKQVAVFNEALSDSELATLTTL